MQPQLQPPPLPRRQHAAQAGRLLRKSLIALVFLAILSGCAWFFLKDRSLPRRATPATVRTASVRTGALERSIRLTGTTIAEKAASMTVPQLRGFRGGGGGGGASSSGGSAASSSAASAASTATAAAASSTASALRGATNRFSSTSTAKTSSSSSSSASRATASTSSAGSSSSGSGDDRMSGGSSDFMQVLQSVAKSGSMVRQDQVVAEFDRQYQLLRLDDYKATVVQSEASLKSLDASLEVSRKAFDLSIEQSKAAVAKANLDLQTTPVRSDIEAERLRLSLEEAESNLKQLQAQSPFQRASERAQRRNSELDLLQSQNELKRAERNIDRMIVKAPMDGMVVMQTVPRGSDLGQIQQGDQLQPGQMFLRIVDPRSMLVSATVNQADVELVRVGARAVLHFDAFPGLELPAKVVALGAMTRTGGMRDKFFKEVPVFLKIERMDPRVIPDLSVGVDVIVEAESGRVIAPLESVFRDASDGRDYVFVSAGNRFERREVTIGLRNYIAASIQSGLRAGEVVALELPESAQPGIARAGGEGNAQRS